MPTTRFVTTFVLALALALGATAVNGCARRETETDAGAAVVDTELMAFLSEARAFHHQANLKEDAGDIPGAAAAMGRLVAAKRPHDLPGSKPMPEVEEVLADAYARLAELELRQNALPRAGEAIRSGLTHAPEPTYFRGHLVEVEGLVEEARSAMLADAGKPAEAARARDRAIGLLEEVVRIQDQVIQHSLAAQSNKSNKEAGP